MPFARSQDATWIDLDGKRTFVMQRWGGAFYIFLSNSNYGVSSFTPDPSIWYHLAIVYDGTGATNPDRLKLYINGVEQSLTWNGTIDATSHTTAPAANLVLGCEHNPGPSTVQFVDGQIGEFVIWDYVGIGFYGLPNKKKGGNCIKKLQKV